MSSTVTPLDPVGVADTSPETISVVICAYTQRRVAALSAALDSLRAQTRPPDEVIVVCDHNDALAEEVRRLAPDVRVLASAGPPGLAGARNHGVEAAHGSIVAFLDDDATAAPDWLVALVHGFAAPGVVAVGGPVIPAFATPRPSWLPREFDWVIGCSYVGQRTTPGPVRNLIGANMAFSRAALREAGGFHAELGRRGDNGLGCEETDVCIRLGRRPGAEIRFEPRARVDHSVSPDRTRLRYFVRRCRAEGRSKRVLAGREGSDSALSSERAYTRRTLPAAVARDLARGLRGDAAGVARAAMALVGLGAALAGFVEQPWRTA